MKKIIFIANNNIGKGLSGGDRIFLEFLKSWQHKSKITIFASSETIDLLKRYKIKKVKIIKTSGYNHSSNYFSLIGLIIHSISRTLQGLLSVIKNCSQIKNSNFLYSVSDFYPDFYPSLLIKLFKPKIKWIAGFYLFAPVPFSKDSPYKKENFLKGLFYYIMQIPTYMFTKLFADFVFVTSNPDILKFPNKKVVVIQGGVDIKPSQNYFKNNSKELDKKYDAVYLGRLHHQKGIIRLIDIWKELTKKIPKAKLVIIGDGELESKLKNKIKKLKLEDNISLKGFLDGPQKYEIFKMSKIVVHPATYDSGGMAAAEAMAWGLPGVSFDLESLKTYYPKGMLKTKCFSNKEFSQNIQNLINNKDLYKKISGEAKNLIYSEWDWNKKTSQIFHQLDS
jgi:glycosyltransferase involved in cell wall biosynthesis